MWSLWLKATRFQKLPSEIMEIDDNVAAWMFNTAVVWFGTTIENALAERYKVTVGKQIEYRPRHTLAKLLNPLFKLPRPLPTVEDNPNPWAALAGWIGKPRSGVKQYKYVA
jgi:hypothetical protein